MNSLTVIKKDEYIEQTISDLKDNTTELIFSHNGIEVIRYHMPKGLHGVFEALKNKHFVETYCILSGKILITPFKEENYTLEPGDTMVITHSNHSYPFKVLEDTIFICNANNEVFYRDKNQIDKLTIIMSKLQEKDGRTKEHCIRVQHLAMKIARELKMDDANLDDLFHASRFHDIGKINIPTEILLKPGPLTPAEKEIMNTHSLESYKMIVDAFGEEIGQMVLQHHEQIDGKGYPYGLKGHQIKLGAKIIAVADAYDAMITKRPYCKAMTPQTAITILLEESATHFDVDCVDALINCLKREFII